MVNKFDKFRKIFIKIPNGEVWKDFKEFVEDKHEASRTVTGIEVQKALKYHMAMEGWKNYPEMIHEGILTEKPPARSHKICSADRILIQEIYKEFEIGKEIPFNYLAKIMRKECDLKDKRTHKTHIEVLIANGVLEETIYDEGNMYTVLEPELSSFE
jgi:hypothetical protein